jgi:hypothetical protein
VLAVPMAAVIQVLLDRFVFSNPDLLPTAEGNLSSSPAPIIGKDGAVGISAGKNSTANPGAMVANGGAAASEEVSLQPASRDRLGVLHLELHELTQDIRKQQREKDSEANQTVEEIEDTLEATAGRLYEMIATHISTKNEQNSSEAL